MQNTKIRSAALLVNPIRLEDEKPESDSQEEKAKAPPSIAQNLFKARTILLFGEINQKVAQNVTAQLLGLAAENDEPIKLIINSPGGHVESGDTIHDMIRFVKPRVLVLGTGWVASAGAHIFLGAAKEDRYCLPNTRFMIHQPAGGVGGPATDIAIEAKEIIKMRKRINEEIAWETGQPYERVAVDTDRNFWMSAHEAKEYGIVSHIINHAEAFK